MKARNVRIVKPYPFTYQFRVKKADSGKTILALFEERFPFRKSKEWIHRIEQGLISVDAKSTAPEFVVREGSIIGHHNPAVQEPSVPDEIHVIQETEEWIAFFKPAPMPIHSGGRYHKNTLQSIVEEELDYPVFVTHRLDAVTSGIVLLAKNQTMAEAISNAFRINLVSKTYVAIVNGIPNQSEWMIEKGIKRKDGFVFESSNDDDAKTAKTTFKLIKTFESESLVECKPITGRTHQIRLHLLESGYPISDDWVYRMENPSQEILQNRAIRLCHNSLSIPTLGIDLKCELPEWWDLEE